MISKMANNVNQLTSEYSKDKIIDYFNLVKTLPNYDDIKIDKKHEIM
jgi:hypothetical protein